MRKDVSSRIIAAALAAGIIILSPGLPAYEAAAQTIQRVPIQTAGAPVGYSPLKALPGGTRSVPGALSSGVSFSAQAGALGALPAPGLISVEAVPSLPAGVAVTPVLLSPELQPVMARATLDQAVESVPALLSPDTPEAEARAGTVVRP